MRIAKLVLDTNVVLDWLWFRDPHCSALNEALDAGRAQVLSHALACTELERVLGYRTLALDACDRERVLEEYRMRTQAVAMPEGFSRESLLLPDRFPICRDADDQPFLALAFHARADALVSRDAEVLALAGRMRRYGIAVIEPPALHAFVS